MHRRSTCVAGRPLHRDDAASALVDRLQDGVRPGVEPAAGVLPPSRQVYPTFGQDFCNQSNQFHYRGPILFQLQTVSELALE